MGAAAQTPHAQDSLSHRAPHALVCVSAIGQPRFCVWACYNPHGRSVRHADRSDALQEGLPAGGHHELAPPPQGRGECFAAPLRLRSSGHPCPTRNVTGCAVPQATQSTPRKGGSPTQPPPKRPPQGDPRLRPAASPPNRPPPAHHPSATAARAPQHPCRGVPSHTAAHAHGPGLYHPAVVANPHAPTALGVMQARNQARRPPVFMSPHTPVLPSTALSWPSSPVEPPESASGSEETCSDSDDNDGGEKASEPRMEDLSEVVRNLEAEGLDEGLYPECVRTSFSPPLLRGEFIDRLGVGLVLRRWISALASASSSAEDEEERDDDEMSETGPWQVRTTARI